MDGLLVTIFLTHRDTMVWGLDTKLASLRAVPAGERANRQTRLKIQKKSKTRLRRVTAS